MGYLQGVAVDSIHGTPLVNAIIQLSGTDRMGITDSLGRFLVDSITPGSYKVEVDHAILDTLGILLTGSYQRRKVSLAQFTAGWRDTFGWFTKDLFAPSDPKIAEAVNDGLAALIWVVVGSLVSKLIVRLTPATKAKA